MKALTLKQKVVSRLIAGGFNENDVVKTVKSHFDYASSQYNSVKSICECIVAIY